MYIAFVSNGHYSTIALIDDKENISLVLKEYYKNKIMLFEYVIYHITTHMEAIIDIFNSKKYKINKLYFDKDFTPNEIIKINNFFI